MSNVKNLPYQSLLFLLYLFSKFQRCTFANEMISRNKPIIGDRKIGLERVVMVLSSNLPLTPGVTALHAQS